jgi:hypothetical protein
MMTKKAEYNTRHDKFIPDSLFALQHEVGQMAGVSIKDLASEAKWLRRIWAGVRLGECLGYIRNGMLLGNPLG